MALSLQFAISVPIWGLKDGAMKRDYYEVLGVERNSDAGHIKKAFRRIALAHHPDQN